MAYNNNIPQATDLISVSQAQLLNNFAAIQNLISVNHVNFNTTDQGKHMWVTMPNQTASPPTGSGFLAGEIGLYNFINATTAKNELYVNKTNQATVVQVPITASILSINSAPTFTPSFGSSGWTYLPSGIILKWGFTTGNGNTLVDFTGLGPTYTTPMAVLLTVQQPVSLASDSDIAVCLGAIISQTQFSVWVSPRTTTGAKTAVFQWLVIGY